MQPRRFWTVIARCGDGITIFLFFFLIFALWWLS